MEDALRLRGERRMGEDMLNRRPVAAMLRDKTDYRRLVKLEIPRPR